jgi:hypothetical protein
MPKSLRRSKNVKSVRKTNVKKSVRKTNVKKSVRNPKVRKSVSKTNVKKSVRKPKVRKSVSKKLYKMGGPLPPIDKEMFRHSYPTANEEDEMRSRYAIPDRYQPSEIPAITHSHTPKIEEPMRINYTDEVAYREDHDEWRMRTGFKKPLTREEQKAKAKAMAKAKAEAESEPDEEMVAVHYMSPRPPLEQRGPTISREYLSEFRRGRNKTNRYNPYVTAARYEANQNRRGQGKVKGQGRR